MPSFFNYQRNLLNKGKTLGEVRKRQADQIILDTWDGDIQSTRCWLFDMYRDPDPTKFRNMEITDEMIPLDIKFSVHTKNTYSKDIPTVHLQMKPGQENCVPYYEEYEYYYGSEWPLGLYVLIPDERGSLRRWMIVDYANFYVNQFPTFEILPCDFTLSYIMDGKKCRVASVLRSQNSYNSGVWRDFHFERPEDQQKMLIPLNRDTEKNFYNMRIIADAKVLSEPRAWRITKVNRLAPNGLVLLTYAEDIFDQHNDYIETETDELGRTRVIGQWADYWKNNVEPAEPPEDEPTWLRSSISCSGVRPFLKVGGGYKTLTVNFTKNDEPAEPVLGYWYYTMAGEDVSTLIVEKPTDQDNQIKIKFAGDESYIGQMLVVTHVTDSTKSTIELPIESL